MQNLRLLVDDPVTEEDASPLQVVDCSIQSHVCQLDEVNVESQKPPLLPRSSQLPFLFLHLYEVARHVRHRGDLFVKLNVRDYSQQMAHKKQDAVILAEKYSEPVVNLADVLVDWAGLVANNCRVKPVVLFNQLHHLQGCFLVPVFDLQVNRDVWLDLLEDLFESAKRILVSGLPFVILEFAVYV